MTHQPTRCVRVQPGARTTKTRGELLRGQDGGRHV